MCLGTMLAQFQMSEPGRYQRNGWAKTSDILTHAHMKVCILYTRNALGNSKTLHKQTTSIKMFRVNRDSIRRQEKPRRFSRQILPEIIR